MRTTHYQLWSNWVQYGPKKAWVRVDNEEPFEMSREDIQGQYDIVPNGRIYNSNPLMEWQKAESRFVRFNNDPYINQEELRRDLLIKDDPRIAKRLMLTVDQIAENLQRRAGMVPGAPPVSPGGQAPKMAGKPGTVPMLGKMSQPSAAAAGGVK